MIVDAVVKRVNISKDKFRIDAFNPRFRFRPLVSLHKKFVGKPIKFFTSWSDLDTNKCLTVNGSKLAKSQVGGTLNRGMIFCYDETCKCCENDNTVFIYMPERLVK